MVVIFSPPCDGLAKRDVPQKRMIKQWIVTHKKGADSRSKRTSARFVGKGTLHLGLHREKLLWKRNKKVSVSVAMICSPIRGTLEGAITSWTTSYASLSRRSLSAAKR